jgi:hypothetical protein
MTPVEILTGLSQGHESLPRQALEAALAQRSEIAPLLLEKLSQTVAEVEALAAGGYESGKVKRFLKKASPLFFGVFLLADWRETAAYRPFARLMRSPFVSHDNLLGEPAVEEPAYRIMARLFDGDPQPIFDIVLDDDAIASARFWQFSALTLIGLEGRLDRKVLREFARQAFERLPRDPDGPDESLIWSGWEKLIAQLALRDLAPLVRKAHEADLLVESEYEDFDRDLAYAEAHPEAPCRPGNEIEAFVGISEVARWVGG